ncbi:MAG TPA: hypothetical protein VMY18_04595 [Acidobacteriota bacterium]|nr:hypothetical protein [Acidobacteriota bacterium]
MAVCQEQDGRNGPRVTKEFQGEWAAVLRRTRESERDEARQPVQSWTAKHRPARKDEDE